MTPTKRPRLMLITPPYHAGVVEAAGVWMPLHFVYLAGHAREAGAEVRIYDAMSMNDSHDDIAAEIEDWRPGMVAVTAITAMEPDAREVCATAKRLDPATLTVLGNVHPTFCWPEILAADENVDLVVRGEGELTLGEIVAAVAAGADLAKVPGVALRVAGRPVATAPRPFARDLDALVPAWDLVDWPRYYYRPSPEGRLAIVSSSRGCSQQCSFCSQQKFWERTWRQRSPESFVGELEMLRDTYGVRVAMLSDETPTVDRQRWEAILDLLIEREVGVELLMETRVDDIVRDESFMAKYAAAGISHVYVGVESTDQATLDRYCKGTRVEQSKRAIELINEHGMVSETAFVLGNPDETPEHIRATIDLAKWYAPDMAFFLAITPWPYSEIYDDLKDYIRSTDYRRYNLVQAVVEPEAMTLEEMNHELQRATGSFFHDKFARLDEQTAEKRRFLLAVLKLLVEHSYLGDHMRAMASGGGEAPEVMRRALEEAGVELPAAISAA